MTLGTKEHHDMMFQFEKEFKHLRLSKEPNELWSTGAVYEDGGVNKLFDAYRRGYSLVPVI